MKDTILTFLLGVFVTISIAATTTSIMTVRPAQPKSTFAKMYENNVSTMQRDCTNFLKKGYVIKSYGYSGYNDASYLVMEKY